MGKVNYTYEINNDSTPSGTDFQQNYDDLDAVVDGALLEENFSPDMMVPIDIHTNMEEVDDLGSGPTNYWRVKSNFFGYVTGWSFYPEVVTAAGSLLLYKNPALSGGTITGDLLDTQAVSGAGWYQKDLLVRLVPGDVIAAVRASDSTTLDLSNVSLTIAMLVKKR